MALRIWFPLIDDVHNQGASGVTVTNTSSTFVTGGKIGNAIQFGTTKSYLKLDDVTPFHSMTECSISLWLKVLTWNTGYATFFQFGLGTTPWTSYILGLLRNNTASTLCFTIANGSNSTQAGCLTPALDLNTWYHLTFTYKDNHCKIYTNGIETKDYTTQYAPNFAGITNGIIGACNNGNNYQTNCLMNDFRIYDHCLSAAEVKEIAQGLVLHYKLDNFQGNYGNPNLCKNSRTFGTGWGGSGTVISDTFNGFAIKYKDNSSGTGSTDTVVYSSVTTVNPNEVYTVSFWAKADIAHSISCFFYNNASGIVQVSRTVASPGNSHTSGDGYINFGLTTEWKYYWITWTFGSSGNAANKTLILGRNSAGSSGISIAQVKLERGSSATAWAPHPNDDDYLPMIVEDNSGYNHSGEVLNTPSLISDTSRYNSCLHISATNQKIKISNFPTSGFGNSYSFSWWAKISSASPMHWGFADGIRLNGMYTGRLWNTGDSSSNPLYKPGTTTQVDTPTANVWHHWVMTGDGTTCKVYQDGVHWGTAKTYKAISGQTIYINGWDSGTNYSSNDYSISDFRIYCTALDADAVRQLYEVGAKIDNKQNLHTFELVEPATKISINKQGQVLCNELEETTTTKFYKTDQIIETNNLIEL